MKTEVKDVSETRKEIRIEIEPSRVRDVYDRISARYAKLATVPGFRRGHTPVSVVRTRFKDDIRGEVLRELVPQAVMDAIKEHNLEAIGEPDVHLDDEQSLEKLGEQPLGLHVHVEVLPEVKLGEYKGLEASRMTRPVTDADVDRVIEGLREASASLQPVEDRGAQPGDIVTVNFHGKFLNEPEGTEDIDVEDVDVELGGEAVQQEFNENLLGMKVDDEKVFTVNYPEDFTSKGLAGKQVEYTAKVTAVRIKEMPELDDEWAKSLGDDYESLSSLREKIREDLQTRATFESDQRLRGTVMQRLVDAHQFEVPESLVVHQANNRLESVVRDMMGRGIDPRGEGFNWEGVRDQLKSQAEFDLRGSFLLESIANAENIEVSDEEIESEINVIAEASHQTPEQVRAALTKQGGAPSIADRLRNRKALELLVENARVTDAEWREEATEDEETNETEAATATEETANIDEEREKGGEAQAQGS